MEFNMEILSLIISLLSGAAGGNIVGAAAPDKSLGTLGNTVAGLFGGGLGSFILQALGVLGHVATTHATGAPATGIEGFDVGSLLANIGGSGVGGALLTFIVGLIKEATKK